MPIKLNDIKKHLEISLKTVSLVIKPHLRVPVPCHRAAFWQGYGNHEQ